ncbi:L-ribulose-5-phosphate 4-epimerase [Eubacteriales bacterium OttesenSCG-928-N13]|nr:L-ribulose-5-phosphate 4-epimerase [Eubacteriales bacterium OttesenSCG-928-N13]
MESLKQLVFEANMQLPEYGLVTFTWGNVSGIDREKGLIVIKPSGVAYETMRADQMVVVDMQGNVVEGELNPSSDTPTHVELYNRFPALGGIVHTHSTHATSFAQAELEVPCYGTTHADYFYGSVPLTRMLTPEEIDQDYELNTGCVIADTFEQGKLDPMATPAVIVRKHGPFTWGSSPMKAVENAAVLDVVCQMAMMTMGLNRDVPPAPASVVDKHYFRKHGANAYYGQKA